jgi:hypothetical protein
MRQWTKSLLGKVNTGDRNLWCDMRRCHEALITLRCRSRVNVCFTHIDALALTYALGGKKYVSRITVERSDDEYATASLW